MGNHRAHERRAHLDQADRVTAPLVVLLPDGGTADAAIAPGASH
jgi:hypothetical protein